MHRRKHTVIPYRRIVDQTKNILRLPENSFHRLPDSGRIHKIHRGEPYTALRIGRDHLVESGRTRSSRRNNVVALARQSGGNRQPEPACPAGHNDSSGFVHWRATFPLGFVFTSPTNRIIAGTL